MSAKKYLIYLPMGQVNAEVIQIWFSEKFHGGKKKTL
jgi:hypothetical protein